MYILLITLHVIACLILIISILLQAGRGGGLTEMLGGETAQSVFGTQAPMLLKRITEWAAVTFLVTSLVLGMVTARSGKSLFDRARLPALPVMPQASPQAATETSSDQEVQPSAAEEARIPVPEEVQAPAQEATQVPEQKEAQTS